MISTSVLALVTAPLAVTLAAAPAQAADVDVTIVGTNDFHGRLLPGFDIPGAAEYAGAVDAIRSENPNTVFAAAGDLIGASTFESFIQHDKPTIDVMNEMGLDVSATGNHEFDQGYDDLANRVMAPYDATTNPEGGAEWQYIAANIDEPGGADLIPPTWTTDVGGVTVGFVGAVTEALPSLVSPAGIDGLTVNDIVTSTNTAAADLVDNQGADIVVLLVHEGASSTTCEAMDDNPDSAFGSIVTGVDANVDAIISGHTHLPYNCTLPVPGGGTRPVVSAGQYGSHLNRLDFTVDDTTGDVTGVAQEILDLNAADYTPDPDVQAIVDQAEADAEGPGSVVLGTIADPFGRAQWLKPDGDDADTEPDRTDNRGGESTLGNLVAEVQRWATRSDQRGNAQIAFMNPGGLRDDMLGNPVGDGTAEVTYRQAANVQPFANTLVNMTMTGRQIHSLLEEQWQPAGASRPFLRLGTSRGFKYTYNSNAEPGKRVGAMWLKGDRIRAKREYSVTANSFLAAGGDNFTTFTEATDQRDTGMADLQAMVDYMAAKGVGDGLAADYAQHAQGLRTPRGHRVKRGGKLRLKLSSLAMTYVGDLHDRKVIAKVHGRRIGAAHVDNSLSLAGSGDEEGGFDEAGRAVLKIKIPKRFKPGPRIVRVRGNRTGTIVNIPIRVTRR